LELSKIIAPFIPFIADDIYRKMRGEKESVHLESWPKTDKVDQKILNNMQETRKLASLALEMRAKNNIKVRQPLQRLTVKSLKLSTEYTDLIKDEVNVKEITEDSILETEAVLDTTLTPELIEEGELRDAIRAIQDWRKEQGLKPGEKASYEVPEARKTFFEKHKEELKTTTNIEF
jgi:isoleucyl-tRNA synthetase